MTLSTPTLLSVLAIIIAAIALGNSQMNKTGPYDDTDVLLAIETLESQANATDQLVTNWVEDSIVQDKFVAEFYNYTLGKFDTVNDRFNKLERPAIPPPTPKPTPPTPTPEPKGPCSANFQMNVVDLDGYLLAKSELARTAPVFIKGTYTDIYKQIEYTVSNEAGEIKAHQFSQVDSKNEFRLAFNIMTDMPSGKYSTEVLIQGQSDCIDFTLE